MLRKFLAAMLSVLYLLSVGLGVSQAQDVEETLTIYSGRSQSLIEPILQRFSEATGIAIEVRYASTAEMAAAILEEGEASPADVFIAQDAGTLGALATADMLALLPTDILERVEPNFQSPDRLWVGLSGRARTLVYNTELVDEEKLPASIMDLTAPEWRGRVGWAPTNASFQANITAMRLLLGEDMTEKWLRDMIANDVRVYPKNTPIVQATIEGEIAVGLVNHYYLFRFLAEEPDIPAALHFFPDGDAGSLINVAGAAILRTSPQPGLAQRLLLYLLGNDAQEHFANETFEYPLVTSVEAASNLLPITDIAAPNIDLSDLTDLEGTFALLSAVGALP